MEIERVNILIDMLLILAALVAKLVLAIDTITTTEFLKDPEVIVSSGSIYKLGFFSLKNSTDKYLGILYNQVPVETFLWIANRNKPVKDSSGSLAISDDGNLVVLNGHKEVLWSTNISSKVSNSSAHLLDTGDLVLVDANNLNVLWESFQDPSDTFYSKMKLSANRNTGEKVELMSWRSDSDPSIGSFSAGLNPVNEIQELFIWKDGVPFSRSGPWNRQVFIGVPYMNHQMVDGITLVDDGEGYIYFSFSYDNQSFLSNFVLTPQGQLEQTFWENGMTDWIIEWKYPKIDCEFYGTCGPFGVCNSQVSPICSCLQGFEPKNSDEWNAGNWTGGCVRKEPLQCLGINGTEGELGKQDGFLKLASVRVPDFAEWSHSTEDKCKDECLTNCSCIAFAYYTGIGCMLWNRSLIDVQKFSSGGADLYIRVAYSELGQSQTRDKKVFIIVGAIVGVIAAAIIAFASWKLILKWRGRKAELNKMPYSDGDLSSPTLSTTQTNLQELPLFKLQALRAATNNFDIENKLGQGGFGLVFKGILPDGQEIAVKRLSRASGQGLEEFMTEVEVISNLQHRNLVKLLGCCIEGEEKMLVYEYMPNKSLASFLFDVQKQEFLDWKTRFSIINGICRGLLYLHRDSRLRIIHRDLKASNILLDENLNPKISDFGMARIFKGTEDEANTRRVVGTYGYMSPEYAMEGLFSEKSDVYSFGVLLIEIISGRRSSSFYSDDQALNLPGYAWKLWNEGNVAGLIDPVIRDPSFRIEVYRCIHVGLLCVQELAQDRPSMPAIISMLGSELVSLPTPKQPAFTQRRVAPIPEPHWSTHTGSSANNVTITMLEGR